VPTEALIESIKKHEGFRAQSYKDTVGVLTIGYGTNLQRLEVDEQLATFLLKREVLHIEKFFNGHFPYLSIESQTRRDVILEMAYNLGIEGVLKFKKMWSAMYSHNWTRAGAEMLDSKWATQVGKRATTLATRMIRGA